MRRAVADGDAFAEIESGYFTALLFCLVAINVLAFLYHLSGATIFNAIANAVSIVLLSVSVRAILKSRLANVHSKAFLLTASAMTSLSVIANFAVASTTDALKYLSIYVFYAAGRACGGEMRPIEQRCIHALALLPIVFLMTKGSSKVYASESFASEIFSYFPNANTGVLYFSALLFAMAPRYGDRVVLLQFVNAALMNKLGAVVATGVAVILWLAFPLRKGSIVAVLVVGTVGWVAASLGAFDRAVATLNNVILVLEVEPATIASMSYKELVDRTGSTDLSAFFRLIHWSNIWNIYSNGSIGTILFGYGAGQTPALTYAELVPHNDYVRVLAEYGLLNLLVFVSFLLHVRLSLKTGATKVLFIILCIYFFSENLLDNFTSMALYFAYAGRLSASSVERWRRLELSRRTWTPGVA